MNKFRKIIDFSLFGIFWFIFGLFGGLISVVALDLFLRFMEIILPNRNPYMGGNGRVYKKLIEVDGDLQNIFQIIIIVAFVIMLTFIVYSFKNTRKWSSDPYRFSMTKKNSFRISEAKIFDIKSILEKSHWNIILFDKDIVKGIIFIRATKEVALWQIGSRLQNSTKILEINAIKSSDIWNVELSCKDKLWIRYGDVDTSTYRTLEETIDNLLVLNE